MIIQVNTILICEMWKTEEEMIHLFQQIKIEAEENILIKV